MKFKSFLRDGEAGNTRATKKSGIATVLLISIRSFKKKIEKKIDLKKSCDPSGSVSQDCNSEIKSFSHEISDAIKMFMNQFTCAK
jgi:uncharacterized protein with PIN domain